MKKQTQAKLLTLSKETLKRVSGGTDEMPLTQRGCVITPTQQGCDDTSYTCVQPQ